VRTLPIIGGLATKGAEAIMGEEEAGEAIIGGGEVMKPDGVAECGKL